LNHEPVNWFENRLSNDLRHNIQANVPPENIVAMFEAAYDYGAY